MFSSFERKIAFRYLRARREEGLISVIALFSLVGISLGVATLIVVLAVMNGVRAEMIHNIIGIEGHVTVYPKHTPSSKNNKPVIAEYQKTVSELATIKGVDFTIPKISGQIMASANRVSIGAMVVAFRADDIDKKPLLVQKIASEGLVALKHGDGVVVGKLMAQKMGLEIGDNITLISPEGRATIAGMVPRVKDYRVVGMFEIGMAFYDSNLIIMPFREAQLYFKLRENGGDNVSSIEIVTDDPETSRNIAMKVARTLGYGYRIYDWKDLNNHTFSAILLQRNVMFLILMLIILVASFNVVSSLIMLVREKGRDIAILRTMGAGRGAVMRIFFMCGASIGVVGTCVGFLLGLLIAFNTENIQTWLESVLERKLFPENLYYLSHLPSKVEFSEVVTVLIFSLSLSFVATIYPALRAAKLDPAEALRYE